MSLKEAYAEGKFRALGITDLGSRDRAPYVEKRLPGVGDPASPSLAPSSEIGARLDDLKRFTKLLTSPAGLKFQANQALLQQGKVQNRTENLKGANFKETLKNIGKRVLDTVAGNISATATILAQIPVNGTGTHFINPINGPAYLREEGGTALDNFFRNTLKLPFNPLGFASGKIASKLFGPGKDKGVNKQFPIDDTLPDKTSLHSYTESPLEYGFKKGEQYTKSGHVDDHLDPKQITVVRNIVTKDGTTKINLSDAAFQSTADFSEYTEFPNQVGAATGYQIKDKEGNDSGGYLSSPYTIKTKFLTSNQTQEDGILHAPYEEYTVTENLEEATSILADYEKKDMIPFYFNIYSPDKGRVVFFRSFLDSWSDTYSGEWSNTKYIGRAEPFFTYNGFNRNITFSFKLAAFRRDDIVPMYEKLNYLLGSTGPTYGQNGQFMRGTLVNLRIGHLLHDVDGFVSSIDLSWNTSYQWEIDSKDEDLEQVPHILDVNVSFTPIHDFNVKSNIDQNNKERYVGRRIIPREPVSPVNQIQARGRSPIPTNKPTGEFDLKKREKAEKINAINPAGISLDTQLPTAGPLDLQPINPPVTPSIKPPAKPPGKKKITPSIPALTLTPTSPLNLTIDTGVQAISDTVQFTTTGEGLDTIGTGAERAAGNGYITD